MRATRVPVAAREHTGDRQLDAVQRNAARIAAKVNLCPFVNGRVKSVNFTGAPSSVIVNHGLGTPAACILIRLNYHPAHNSPRFTEADQSGLDANNQLKITADAICTADFWFYPRSSLTIPVSSDQST